MQKYVKFLRRLPRQLRERLIAAVERISNGELNHLDIKPLVSKGNFYRCRIGKVRIVFEKRGNENIIHDIGFRGNVYN